ncbi:sulfur carrier protein [Polaromonas sp. OV174]|uniref:sulfur carrier protein ThiS n=1 Tax=Polaromonas sp. OV174 TaxID=1855300 RepID=UPI0008ED4E5B|nr:sulfur carrier protein ThiS [Polaromonas sp. OV174]SFB83626.1 sulfur carrier protein [Polaromonas sp. OV174]
MTRLEISLNGERLQTQAGTLQTLLLERGYELKSAFACAINSSFVPRPQWPARALQNGDRIDVVTPITGG